MLAKFEKENAKLNFSTRLTVKVQGVLQRETGNHSLPRYYRAGLI